MVNPLIAAEDVLREIASLLEVFPQLADDEELFKDTFSRVQLIVTFLALLELLRLGLARVYQEKEFGNIWIINPRNQETAGSQQAAP